jgi:hypothetical protein
MFLLLSDNLKVVQRLERNSPIYIYAYESQFMDAKATLPLY